MLITRRILLSSVAALALNLPAFGQIASFGATPIPFQGNPNVTITTIDVSRGIACSRTSGKTPCFIQVSASAITATGTTVPYQDLSYSWNFGDPSGTEIFTNPANGQSVNANIRQTGPEAAYCYRNAGTYTVTLTCTGKNGSNYVSKTVTQTITVAAFSAANTWYYDANATGANNGTSPTDAYTALTTISANVNGATGNTQIYLARGSHWVSTVFIDITKTTGLRFSPYGSGVDPIMECATETSSATKPLLSIRTSSSTGCADVVISNFNLVVSGNQFTSSNIATAASSNNNHTLDSIYFDNSSFTSNLSYSHRMNLVTAQYNSKTASANLDRFGIWGGSINSIPGDGAFGMAFFGGAHNWTFIMGLTNVNGIGGATFNSRVHHFYISVADHALFRWTNFGSSIVSGTATRNYCVKIDNYPTPKYNISAYSSGAGAAVRVTVPDTSQYTNGANVYIENVTGTGAVDITNPGQTIGQGIWVCSIVDGANIDLVGTTFNADRVHIGGDLSAVRGANYFLVDGNNITGTQRSFDSNNNYGNPYASWQSDYVIQKNIVHDMPYGGLFSGHIGIDLTYRDNNHWNNTNKQVAPDQGTPQYHATIWRVYRNKFYMPTSPVGFGNSDDSIVDFNVNSETWSDPLTFTDNIIQDMRTVAGAVGLDSYSADAAWIIDRNQYYAPNATANKFLYNGSTPTTFASWQAAGFDANGRVANPNWLDPTNGKF